MDSGMDFTNDAEFKLEVDYGDEGANSYFIAPTNTTLTPKSPDFNPQLQRKEEDRPRSIGKSALPKRNQNAKDNDDRNRNRTRTCVMEKILEKRIESDGSTSYRIKWLPHESWEPQANLAADMVQDFEQELAANAKKTKMDKAVAKKPKPKNDVSKSSTARPAPKVALPNTETRAGIETQAEDSVTAKRQQGRNSGESLKNAKRVKPTPAADLSDAGGAAGKSFPTNRKLKIREATTSDSDNTNRRQLRPRKIVAIPTLAPQTQETQEDPPARAVGLKQTAKMVKTKQATRRSTGGYKPRLQTPTNKVPPAEGVAKRPHRYRPGTVALMALSRHRQW